MVASQSIGLRMKETGEMQYILAPSVKAVSKEISPRSWYLHEWRNNSIRPIIGKRNNSICKNGLLWNPHDTNASQAALGQQAYVFAECSMCDHDSFWISG